MKSMMLRALPAALLAAFSGVASAAAFQLLEQNASGLGVAYAGSAAVADNASTIFFNPAGMTQLSGVRLSLGANAIGPSYEFDNNGSSGLFNGRGDGGNAGGWAVVPNAYASWRIADAWALGLGISSPFGLSTEYDDDWVGRAFARKSEIRTINYNPSLAWKAHDKVSLGLGLNYQTIDAQMTSYLPGAFRESKLEGDDSAWGWNAGVLFTLSPAMRVGLSYRSTMDYRLEGTAKTAVSSQPVRADLELPDSLTLSVWQQVSDRWEAMGDISYTRWSTIKSLDVYNRNSGALVSKESFRYDDSWRVAWGAAYKFNPAWKLKFGIAYDKTPVKEEARSPRVPDNDRLWLSLGGQWDAGNWGRVDVGYAYLYVRDPSVDLTKSISGFAHRLRGEYDASAHLVGVQYSVGF